MKRRQFSAMLATATFSLGGLTGASAQETDPLRVEDVSVKVGGLATAVGRAELTFQDGTMRFQVRDWTMEGGTRSLAIGAAEVTVEDVSAETYSTVRSGMAETFSGGSLSPLVDALAVADVNPDSSVRVSAGPVEMDGQLVADQITATGTVDSVVPEGTRDITQDGATLAEIAALGPSEWDRLNVTRGSAELALTDVVIELSGATLSISTPEGTAELPERSLELNDVTMNIRPPESIPQEHVEFASRLRQLGADESLTLSEIRSAADESGVTAANTEEAIRNARFDLTLGEVIEDGETLVSNFETSGTLAELFQLLPTRTGDDDDGGELSKEAIVSTPGTDEYFDYVFEVTGDLEELEPDEDRRHAVDDVIDLGDRVRVEGSVGTGDDRFAFSGDLIEVDVPPEVQIEIRDR